MVVAKDSLFYVLCLAVELAGRAETQYESASASGLKVGGSAGELNIPQSLDHQKRQPELGWERSIYHPGTCGMSPSIQAACGR